MIIAKNIVYITIFLALYITNKYHIIVFDNLYVAYFMRCYFNDIVGSVAMLFVMRVLLLPFNKPAPLKLYHIEVFMFLCGIFWEFVTPLYRKDTTTDILDIIAYMVGGAIYWIMTLIERKMSDN